jgi:hypothetical protein
MRHLCAIIRVQKERRTKQCISTKSATPRPKRPHKLPLRTLPLSAAPSVGNPMSAAVCGKPTPKMRETPPSIKATVLTRWGRGARNFIIPHSSQFVKRKNRKKHTKGRSRICAILPVDFWIMVCYNTDTKLRERWTEWVNWCGLMKNTVWTARWRAELQCPTGHGWRVRNDPPILKK